MNGWNRDLAAYSDGNTMHSDELQTTCVGFLNLQAQLDGLLGPLDKLV